MIKVWPPAASVTPTATSTFTATATYGSNEATLINNLKTRLAELEAFVEKAASR